MKHEIWIKNEYDAFNYILKIATEDDLRAAGYVKASPGMTQEQRIENQANGLRIAYKELDDLKMRVSGLRRMNDELAEKNEELIGLKNELGVKCERLEAMNDDLRSKLKKEYLEEVKDHNYTIDRVRELEKALRKISMICDYPKAAQ